MPRLPESEKSFQAWLIEHAQLSGWHVAHFKKVLIARPNGTKYWATPAVADGPGFPDLVMVRDRVIFAEVKKMMGVRQPNQVEWGDKLEAAGSEYYVWDPSDRDEIMLVLAKR